MSYGWRCLPPHVGILLQLWTLWGLDDSLCVLCVNLNVQMAIFSPVSKDVGCLHVVLKDATVPGAGREGNPCLPKAICS